MHTPSSPEVVREQGLRAGERYLDHFIPQYRGWLANGRRGFDPAEARDAAHECEHGRLAGDRPCPDWPHSDPCGCWPGERMKPCRLPHLTLTPYPPKEDTVIEYIGDKPTTHPDVGKPRKRTAKATTPVAGTSRVPPVIAQAIAQLDAEIAELTRARDALKAVVR